MPDWSRGIFKISVFPFVGDFNPYNAETHCRRPLIFQTMNSAKSIPAKPAESCNKSGTSKRQAKTLNFPRKY